MLTKDIDIGVIDFVAGGQIWLNEDVGSLIIDDTKLIIKWASGSTEIFPLHQIEAVHLGHCSIE